MKKRRPEPIKHYCRECAHAVNPYCKSMATGENIMAECDANEFDVLLSFGACDKFKEKQLKNG